MKSSAKTYDEHRRMTESPMMPLIAALSLPTLISMLVTTIYNTADTYFVAMLKDSSATGAVTVVFAIQALIQAFGYGVGMGGGSLASRLLGAKRDEDADRIASSAVVLSFSVGLLIGVLGLIFLDPMLVAFGSTETILPKARQYASYLLAAAPIFCASFVLNNLLRAEGKSRFSMIGLGIGGLLNIALDPLFIFAFKMGVGGASLATAVSQCFSFVILLSFFLLKKSKLRLSITSISKKPADYLLIARTGLPTVCRQGLSSVSTTLLNIALNPFGDATISAVGIAGKVYMLYRSIILGIGQGFQPVAGYNYGAKRNDRVKSAFVCACALGSAFSVAAAVVTLLFPGAIMSFFPLGSAEVVEVGSKMLRFLGMVLPVLAFSTYVNQLYQSLGFVAGATFLASCRQGIFFIPLVLTLPRFFGLTGIQMTQALADLFTFVVSLPAFLWFWKKHLPVPAETPSEPTKPEA